MSKMKDRVGEIYHRLTIISFDKLVSYKNSKDYFWNCICTCGNIKSIAYGKLQQGHTKSCGCLKSETHLKTFKKHGMRKSSEYNTWSGMIKRCTNKNNKDYPNYGGRGIKVCDRWLNSFENFIEDMGLKPFIKYSIERINVNGDYEKDNCKWASNLEQANNKRNNVKVINIITNEEYPSIVEAAKSINMKTKTLRSQLNEINKNKTNLRICKI